MKISSGALCIGFIGLSTAALWATLISCAEAAGGGTSRVDDEHHAGTVAWAVASALFRAAPNSGGSSTWNGAVIKGYTSGTATTNGSFTYSYDSYSGYKEETYSNVVVVLSDFADIDTDPRVSGTVTLGGTCTTTYGYTTSYGGYWYSPQSQITLGGPYTGKVSVELFWQRAGLDFGAVVIADGTEYDLAY